MLLWSWTGGGTNLWIFPGQTGWCSSSPAVSMGGTSMGACSEGHWCAMSTSHLCSSSAQWARLCIKDFQPWTMWLKQVLWMTFSFMGSSQPRWDTFKIPSKTPVIMNGNIYWLPTMYQKQAQETKMNKTWFLPTRSLTGGSEEGKQQTGNLKLSCRQSHGL